MLQVCVWFGSVAETEWARWCTYKCTSRPVKTHPAVQFGHLKFKWPAGWSTEACTCGAVVQQLSAYQPDMGGARRGFRRSVRACLWTVFQYRELCFTYFYKVIWGNRKIEFRLFPLKDFVGQRWDQSAGAAAGPALLCCCSVHPTNSRRSGFLKVGAPPPLTVDIKAVDDVKAAVGLRLSPLSCYTCSKARRSRATGTVSLRAFTPWFRCSECLGSTGQGAFINSPADASPFSEIWLPFVFRMV